MSKRGQPTPDRSPQGQRLPSLLAPRWASLLAGGVIVFAALAAYHNCFSVPFLLDDNEMARRIESRLAHYRAGRAYHVISEGTTP